MPVYRAPDGRIVEERTTVTPPGARQHQDADGTAAGRDEATARRQGGGPAPETARRRAGYADPTVVRRPAAPAGGRPVRDEERTRLAGAVPTDATGSAETDPVAGWLVIVDGPGVGRDLRIGVGRNDLGRDRDNRIALPFGDTRISRRTHLWVNYDPLHRAFSVAPGNSTNLAYLNDAPIEERMPLADGATIAIGRTKLRFAAFCGDRFAWPDAE